MIVIKIVYCFMLVTSITADNTESYEYLTKNLYQLTPSTQNIENNLRICLNNIIFEIVKHSDFIYDALYIESEEMKIHLLHDLGIRFLVGDSRVGMFTQINILNAENIKAAKSLLNSSITTHLSYRTNFIIIIENNDVENLDEATRFLWFHNLVNVTLLMRNGEDYNVYTFDSPIRFCQNPLLLQIVQCSEYEGGSHIFPITDKHSFTDCHIKVAALNEYPYVYFANKDNSQSKLTEGLEQLMVRRMCEYYDIGVEITELNQTTNRSTENFVQDFMYEDALATLEDNNVQMTIGGYYLGNNLWERAGYLYPLLNEKMMMIVSVKYMLDGWEAILSNSKLLLVFIICLCVIFSIITYSISIFSSHKTDFYRYLLIIYGSVISQPVPIASRKGFSRVILLICIFLTMFIIPYGFQASLTSVKMKAFKSAMPKNFEELVEHFEAVVPKDWKRLSDFRYGPACEDRLDCLRFLSHNTYDKYYTVTPNLIFEMSKWMLIDDQCELNLYFLKNLSVIVLRAVFVRRGSPFLDIFNKYYFLDVEFGFTQADERDIQTEQKLRCRYHGKSLSSLNMADMKIPFTVFIIGISTSLLVFIVEINKKERLQQQI